MAKWVERRYRPCTALEAIEAVIVAELRTQNLKNEKKCLRFGAFLLELGLLIFGDWEAARAGSVGLMRAAKDRPDPIATCGQLWADAARAAGVPEAELLRLLARYGAHSFGPVIAGHRCNMLLTAGGTGDVFVALI